MKETKAKKSKSLFNAIVGRFSYKQGHLLFALSLFAAAGIMAYLNSGSSALLAAPALEIVSDNQSAINRLVIVLLVAAFVLALSSIKKKK